MGEILEVRLENLNVVLRQQVSPRSPGSRIGSF